VRTSRQLGLAARNAVLVMAVTPGAPADKAGLRPRDIVVAVDGQETPNVDAIHKQLDRASPGKHLEVSYVRGGQKMTAAVVIAERPRQL
jgi:S1-C subfamily serine protease